jgi:alkanesulfonate monooxygenase SsuD/methylene tetrahydromethanopterin reductase-like flavin-dependent oxidoreductase (luciferase family)
MRIGVVFPQTELGGDAGAVRAWAQRAEALGFTHVLAYDHVVGADPAVHKGWDRAYDVRTTFHEPMVLYGYLAAVTSMELVTGIIILPQRQTVLAAKQAAEVDLLTGGKFRLGVGIGWNRVEYEALGQDFVLQRRAAGRAGRPAAPAVDRAERDVHRGLRPGHRGGPGADAGAAADPGVVRRAVATRLAPGRTAGRRLVPANGPGPAAGGGPPDGHRGGCGGRP